MQARSRSEEMLVALGMLTEVIGQSLRLVARQHWDAARRPSNDG